MISLISEILNYFEKYFMVSLISEILNYFEKYFMVSLISEILNYFEKYLVEYEVRRKQEQTRFCWKKIV
jgi:hypothetical protein